jgi:hypothetical protein
MKKTIILLIIIIAIAALVWFNREGNGRAGGIEGTSSSIDTEQAVFDGPYVIIIETDDGVQEVVHVPSMGINLCEAKGSIASPSELSNGMRVAVSGTRAEGGVIVPCESADHYLRVI